MADIRLDLEFAEQVLDRLAATDRRTCERVEEAIEAIGLHPSSQFARRGQVRLPDHTFAWDVTVRGPLKDHRIYWRFEGADVFILGISD